MYQTIINLVGRLSCQFCGWQEFRWMKVYRLSFLFTETVCCLCPLSHEDYLVWRGWGWGVVVGKVMKLNASELLSVLWLL